MGDGASHQKHCLSSRHPANPSHDVSRQRSLLERCAHLVSQGHEVGHVRQMLRDVGDEPRLYDTDPGSL